MKRRGGMDFVLHRLRLLNCFQGGQPGDLGYGCTMHWEPEGMVDAAWGLHRGKTEVINPYLQLTRFPLTVADIPQLASYLEDERFILAVRLLARLPSQPPPSPGERSRRELDRRP